MVDTFKKQFKIRDKIWPDELLPEFELFTIRDFQSVADEKTEFREWFEDLEWMKDEISRADFDIAIIGCGAYGFPLAAYVKRLGKKAVHMAGAAKLIFCVCNRAWEVDPKQPFNKLYERVLG